MHVVECQWKYHSNNDLVSTITTMSSAIKLTSLHKKENMILKSQLPNLDCRWIKILQNFLPTCDIQCPQDCMVLLHMTNPKYVSIIKLQTQLNTMHTQSKPSLIWRSPLLKVNPVTTDRHHGSITLSNTETAMTLQNKKDCCHTWFTLPWYSKWILSCLDILWSPQCLSKSSVWHCNHSWL